MNISKIALRTRFVQALAEFISMFCLSYSTLRSLSGWVEDLAILASGIVGDGLDNMIRK